MFLLRLLLWEIYVVFYQERERLNVLDKKSFERKDCYLLSQDLQSFLLDRFLWLMILRGRDMRDKKPSSSFFSIHQRKELRFYCKNASQSWDLIRLEEAFFSFLFFLPDTLLHFCSYFVVKTWRDHDQHCRKKKEKASLMIDIRLPSSSYDGKPRLMLSIGHICMLLKDRKKSVSIWDVSFLCPHIRKSWEMYL